MSVDNGAVVPGFPDLLQDQGFPPGDLGAGVLPGAEHIEVVDAVVGHQKLWPGGLGDRGQIGGEGVDGAVVLLPLGSPLRKPARILHLVEQNVTASAVFGDDRQGAGVAGDQNLPVGRLKKVRIAFQRAVVSPLLIS